MKRLSFVRVVLALGLVHAAGCVPSDPPTRYGDPTNLGVATTQSGITVQVFSPTPGETLPEPTASVELAAYTSDSAPLEVTVTTSEGYVFTATASGAAGPDQRFRVDVPVLHGDNVLSVRVRETSGLRNRRMALLTHYEGTTPALRFGLYDDRSGTPCGTSLPHDLTAKTSLCVRGKVTTEAAASTFVTLDVDGGSATTAPLDAEGRFEAALPLAKDATQAITVSVTDAAGRASSTSRSVVQDSTPPTLAAPLSLTSPTRTAALGITVSGTVSDEHGLASLTLANDVGGKVSLVPTASFSRAVDLVPGSNHFTLAATDVAGNVAELAFEVIRDRLIRLAAPGSAGQAVLNLDKNALSQLLTEQDQKDTDVVEISLRTPVLKALYSIRDPELFGVDTSAWGKPEWNLHDLLNMTPDTADLSGSSLANLLDIAPAVGLPSPRLLANLLALQPTDTFVDLETTADVVLDQLIATHPNIAFDAAGKPVFRLTMYDVLNDLAPLAGRFGPTGSHPGFLSGAVHSQVFEPGFLMSIPASSNLVPYQGVDASRGGKDYFFVPKANPLLVLDFLSPDFSVVGLVDEPTVDMKFTMGESSQFFGVSTVKAAGADAQHPGFYRGNSPVWGAAPWTMERIVAETAYRQYRPLYATSYANTQRYDTGAITDAAVIAWDHGWVSITTSGGIGNPPPPTYVWDVLNEVAQLRLHQGGVPEGGVNLAFQLDDLPIGLDAAGLVDALRPTLASQAAELANRLVSPDGLVKSGADFYFVPSTNGGPGFLFFRAPADASGTYGYPKPGFFTSASLATRASTTTALSGTTDTTHEKLVPVVGTHVFFADDGGTVFDLEIVTVDAQGVEVRVTPVGVYP